MSKLGLESTSTTMPPLSRWFSRGARHAEARGLNAAIRRPRAPVDTSVASLC